MAIPLFRSSWLRMASGRRCAPLDRVVSPAMIREPGPDVQPTAQPFFLATQPALAYARPMSVFVPPKAVPIRQATKRAWRRYRAVPRRWRWPLTFLAAFFLVIIFSNLLFGNSSSSELLEFRLEPGGEASAVRDIDPGHNSVVFWTLIDSSNGQPQIEAAVAGPGLRDDEVHSGVEGSISFKGGFTRSEFAFFMRNTSDTASGIWRITWSVR